MYIWVVTRNDNDSIDSSNTFGELICVGLTTKAAIRGVLDILLHRLTFYEVITVTPGVLYSVHIGIKGVLDPSVVYHRYYAVSKVVIYNEND